MHRLLISMALAAPLIVACSGSFKDKRTPSGDYCSDMPVIPAGSAPDREYHRLQPVASDPEARTEAERLESLRKAACSSGGDAVIEAVNEEIRLENGNYGTVASGTAVRWILRPTSTTPKPITLHPINPQPTSTAAEEAPPPGDGTTPGATGTAQPTATPIGTGTAKPPTKSALPTATTTGTASKPPGTTPGSTTSPAPTGTAPKLPKK